jgi:luciferase family oxidoreductase group 1
MSPSIPLSVLDLVPVPSGTTAAQALRHAVELARCAEALGYARLWYAEHHDLPSVASSTPAVLIAHAAAATRTLRVGSGGVMLHNHAPLAVAEAFRTLNALHPGRIDLGLGRAPGSDRKASIALRAVDGEHFADLVEELRVWSGEIALPEDHPLRNLRAMPDDAPLPPIWVLGSSGASAEYAGRHGFGYSFASHFSPTPAAPAFEAYRSAFRPSAAFAQPHAILGVSAICAPTADEAEYHAGSMQLAWVRLRSGRPMALPHPDEARGREYSPAEQQIARAFRALTLVGTPAQVMVEIRTRAAECGADEVMVVCNAYDPGARLRSYTLLAEAAGLVARAAVPA